MKYWFLFLLVVSGVAGCNNSPDSSTDPLHSDQPADSTPPTQSGIYFRPYCDSVVVTWTTNEPAIGRLYYGTSNPPADYKEESAYGTNHRIMKAGPQWNVVSYYQVDSRDQADPANCSPREPVQPMLIIDTVDPVVDWRTPDTAVLTGVVTLAVYAHENVCIQEVLLYVDGVRTGEFDFPAGLPGPLNCTLQWDCTTVEDGGHTLNAVIWDGVGNASSANIGVTVQNHFPPPSLGWREPADNAVCSEVAHVRVRTRYSYPVRCLVDGQPVDLVSARLDWESPEWSVCSGDVLSGDVGAGTHTFAAQACTPVGDCVTTASVDVTLTDDVPPRLSWIAPLSNAMIADFLDMEVSAWDLGGRVDYVDFLLDRVPVARDSASSDCGNPNHPVYCVQHWDLSSVVPGRHTLTAVARDWHGNEAETSIEVTRSAKRLERGGVGDRR